MVSTGSPSQIKVARVLHRPPHSHLSLRLRMGKTVHLLPTVPAMACYGVTFYIVYIISFGAVHGKEKNCSIL